MNPNYKTVFIETYGCSANQNNSEILAGLLSQAGFIITNNRELADIIILNTCVVKEKTEDKIEQEIKDLKQFSSKKLLIIAGCMPQTDAKKIKKLNSNAILMGTKNYKEILNLIRDWQERKLDGKRQEDYLKNKEELKINLPKLPLNKLISIHQISEGCLGNCTYCKTKLAKGALFSYPKEEIIKSIESDLQAGAKEIWLTSQDNPLYGLDQKDKKQKYIELIKEILDLKHKFRLRLGMSNPNNILPILRDLIEVYREEKIYKFLHISIQSASNKILKDMNRKYKIEEVERIISDFKKEIPNIVIATDIIVGYPTETDSDHKANIEFLEKYKPDVLNISKFSSHKGTEAGKLKTLKGSIIKKRTTELMQIHRETAKENKQKYLGKTINVFINKKLGDKLHEARAENYNIILVKCEKEMLGKEAEVIVKEIGVHHMVGELTTKEK
jgi:MiaB-like tRNA modifying enzyme